MSKSEADELREIERKRTRALVDRDLTVAGDFHADDYELINPAGAAFSKERYLGIIASVEFRYLAWEIQSPIRVRLDNDLSVLRYEVFLHAEFKGQEVARGRHWHTDVYERRSGRWQVVWSQATAIV